MAQSIALRILSQLRSKKIADKKMNSVGKHSHGVVQLNGCISLLIFPPFFSAFGCKVLGFDPQAYGCQQGIRTSKHDSLAD